jgi:hypothetical protein
MPLAHDTLSRRASELIQYHREAEIRNEWTFFVDEMYAEDCVYVCEYGGTMVVKADGVEQIKATHYGRDMQYGWEGWTFPYMGVYVGTDNRIVTHWMNRGPGKRADGSYFETPGVSFITFDDNGKICRQHDLFDLAHQMKLCDELHAAGLLNPALLDSWVKPMKAKLKAMLGI